MMNGPACGVVCQFLYRCGMEGFHLEQKILIVDDEQRMRKLVKDFLVREDFQVLEAADGESAVDIF